MKSPRRLKPPSTPRQVRAVSTSGVVTTIAGVATAYSLQDGTGTNANFYDPADLAVDSTGTIWVADGINNYVRKARDTIAACISLH